MCSCLINAMHLIRMNYLISRHIFCILQFARGIDDSCPISKETVQIVDDCPPNEQQWIEASERKNCLAYAKYCENPDKFAYHCVINSNLNETLEVCAYVQNIVGGNLKLCREYF